MPILGVIASSKLGIPTINFRLFPYQGSAVFNSTDGISWTWEESPTYINAANDGTDNPVQGNLTSANGKLFAYMQGSVIYSTNGTSYSFRGMNLDVVSTWGMKYLNNAYWMAVESVTTSTDGFNWTVPNVGDYGNFRDITYGNSTYVAVSGVGYAYTSTNGITWTSRTMPSVFVAYSVIYSDKFVSSGYNANNSYGLFATSTDGITWTTRNGAIASVSIASQVVWNGSVYISPANGASAVHYSTDAITWSSKALSTTETNWFFGLYGERFLIGSYGSNGQVASSTDGNTWTMRSFGYATPINSMTYITGKYYMAMGSSAGTTPQTSVVTSTDTVTWSLDYNFAYHGAAFDMTVIQYNNSYYGLSAAAVDGNLWVSTNGTTWSTRAVGFTTGSANANNLFASSNLWLLSNGDAVLYSSTDGITWTSRTNPVFPTFQNAFANNPSATNAYIGVGSNGSVITSTNGVSWTSRTVGTTTWRAATSALGIYVIMGGSTAATSTDGVTWTTRTVPGGTYRYVEYSNNQFIGCGSGGRIATSTDGITWTTRTSNVSGTIYKLKWVTGIGYVSTFQPYTGTQRYPTYITSTDGITWTSRTANITTERIILQNIS